MNIQYKPSKPKNEKSVKVPKVPKAEKPISFGSAKAVKLEKPQKVKEPKVPKAPKLEKAVAFTPAKVEKVEQFKGVTKLKQSVNSKILAAVLVAVAVASLAVVLAFNLQDNEPIIEPKSLSISAYPNKTTYYVGEAAAFSDLKLKMTLTNGATITVDGSECEITGFDSSTPVEMQTITVKYKEVHTTFTITVKEILNSIPSGKYNGLSFKTLPKTDYKVGEWPDPSGGVLIVHYDDGTTREMELTNDYIYNFTTAKPGTYTITVKYVERGIYGETTYTITVTE